MTDKNLTKEYLEQIVADLIAEGESQGELSLWVDMFDAMETTEKEKLIANLEKELEELKKLK